jgi:hypothetical protein
MGKLDGRVAIVTGSSLIASFRYETAFEPSLACR